jgi:hypothetical protein
MDLSRMVSEEWVPIFLTSVFELLSCGIAVYRSKILISVFAIRDA